MKFTYTDYMSLTSLSCYSFALVFPNTTYNYSIWVRDGGCIVGARAQTERSEFSL